MASFFCPLFRPLPEIFMRCSRSVFSYEKCFLGNDSVPCSERLAGLPTLTPFQNTT